ncbi:MAG: YiaA/YiaB family inner membrane protein, partial [Polyangiales bacterium]
MDQHNESILKDTPAWIFQVWTAFVLSFGASLVGIAYLPLALWAKGFVALAYLFTVSSAFTLAKT